MGESLIGATRTGGDEAADYRRVLGRFPTGVVVVAACCDGTPYGMAVNSFTSVSLRPRLIAFCADLASTTWPYLRQAGRFAVSVLAGHQEPECRVFAAKGADRFASVTWSTNASGQPVLDEAVAWLDCVVEQVLPAGDHELVLGRVLAAYDRPGRAALVFHSGRFVAV